MQTGREDVGIPFYPFEKLPRQRARTEQGPRTSVTTVRKGLSMLAAVVGSSLHEHPAGDKLQMNVFRHLRHSTGSWTRGS